MSDFLRRLDEALRFPERIFHGAHSIPPSSKSPNCVNSQGGTASGYSYPCGSGGDYSGKLGEQFKNLPGGESMDVGPLGETEPGHLPRGIDSTQLKPTGSEYSNPTDRGFGYVGFQGTQPTKQSVGGDRDWESQQYREWSTRYPAGGQNLGGRGSQHDQSEGLVPSSSSRQYGNTEYTLGNSVRRPGDYALASYYDDVGASKYEGQGVGQQDVLGMGFAPSTVRAEQRRSVGGVGLGGASHLSAPAAVEETRDQLGELGLEKQ